MSGDWVGGVLGAGDLVSCVQVVWMEVRVRMELMMRSVAEGEAGRRHQDTAHHATDSGHTQLDVPGHAG